MVFNYLIIEFKLFLNTFFAVVFGPHPQVLRSDSWLGTQESLLGWLGSYVMPRIKFRSVMFKANTNTHPLYYYSSPFPHFLMGLRSLENLNLCSTNPVHLVSCKCGSMIVLLLPFFQSTPFVL